MLKRPKLFRTLIEARSGSVPSQIDDWTMESMEREFLHGGLDGVQPFVRFSEVIDTVKFVLSHNGLTADIPEHPEKAGKRAIPIFWGSLTDAPIGTLYLSWTHKGPNHWTASVRVTS
jgi:hypothetical protein